MILGLIDLLLHENSSFSSKKFISTHYGTVAVYYAVCYIEEQLNVIIITDCFTNPNIQPGTTINL